MSSDLIISAELAFKGVALVGPRGEGFAFCARYSFELKGWNGGCFDGLKRRLIVTGGLRWNKCALGKIPDLSILIGSSPVNRCDSLNLLSDPTTTNKSIHLRE